MAIFDKLLRFDQPFGDTDSRKEKLQELTGQLKEKLDEKLSDLKIDTSKLGKQALVIGGSITAAYILLQLLLPDADDDAPRNGNSPIYVERKSESSWVSKTIQTFIITTVLEIARQQLVAFLESQNQTDASQDISTTTNQEG